MIATIVAVLVVSVLAFTGCGSGSSSKAGSSSSASGQSPAGITTVVESALPDQARDVISRIDHGGTFKYRQDGAIFANREGLLPGEPRGYYREYTVDTPGVPDRGPRRVILGSQGELYYTSDHYRSFEGVVRDGAS